MIRSRLLLAVLFPIVCLSLPALAWSDDLSISTLRLVPFPRQVQRVSGLFVLSEHLTLQAPVAEAEWIGRRVTRELELAHAPLWKVKATNTSPFCLRIAAEEGELRPHEFPADAPAGSYSLQLSPEGVCCTGVDLAGLHYGVETLCQLIRANRSDSALPCLTIRDWPSLTWRCFQDDLTRGPSSTLATLEQQVDLGAELKMNLFTYYMEYQYAFEKHPNIGPPDGSLLPSELKALVQYAKTRHVDILGNQQSFGHFTGILKHPEYAALRETSYLLCPTNEESYRLLDDLYSEECPLLPFPMFNVCCDETEGLGTGPSKALADEIGVGGVYVRHIRRVHDLLKEKYDKRMMMWGDIILQHPDKLEQIPKDTVMLTWGYGPNASFEHQILPFKESGYEFFVCPGISNWSRILPDFAVTTTNIQNFVRDGVKHGALGMLNTAWEDDGEALQGYKWHGYAWGAECAWNASATSLEDFNRRVGGVLFGEPGDHFGQAIALLSKTHSLPGMQAMLNARFWQNDFLPRQGASATRKSAQRLLDIVQPAIEHLEACRRDAVVNAPLLDAFLLGARRMELIGQRMLDGLRAVESYAAAYDASDRDERVKRVTESEQLVQKTRQAHRDLGEEFKRIWLSESKPYALDWTMKRYAEMDIWYQTLGDRLRDARRKAEQGEAIPSPAGLGLASSTSYLRQTRPYAVSTDALKPDAQWFEPTATHRLGITVEAGNVDRYELPVEVDVAISDQLATLPLRAFWLREGGEPRELLAQWDEVADSAKHRLTLVVPGPIAQNTSAEIQVYCGLPAPGEPLAAAAKTDESDEQLKRMENGALRLLLGSEGAHVYRCEVKDADDRDVTTPGETGWAGLADLSGDYRAARNKLTCTARGPAVVRYVCEDAHEMVKTISLFGGVSWLEVVLNEPVGYYWDFDDPQLFAADSPSPGTYLFSDGTTGPVGSNAEAVAGQVKVARANWAIKWNQQKLALGMAAPEVAARFVVGPGAGAGGVGIEGGPPAGHFITFAGVLRQSPDETMQRLQQTLDFTNQPKVVVWKLQEKP